LAHSRTWPYQPDTDLLFAKPVAEKVDRAIHNNEQSGIFIAFRMEPRSR
jgi:hypothetical protein